MISIPDAMHAYLFGVENQWARKQATTWTRPPAGMDPDTLNTDHPRCTEQRESESEDISEPELVAAPNSLKIISYNTDDCARQRAAEVLSFASEVNADIILLQDTAGLLVHSSALGQGLGNA